MPAALAVVSVLVVLGGCGSAPKPARAPVTASGTPTAGGGLVETDVSAGRLGPADLATPGGERVIGRPGRVAPSRGGRTHAQRNGVAAGPACGDSGLAPDASSLPRIAASVLCLLNAERANAGLPPLSVDAQLARASQPMADLMVEQQFFSHVTPDARGLVERVQPTGYLPRSDTWVLGENLAWGSGALATPQAIVNGWMNSPGHRANILAVDYRDIGIGLALGSPVPDETGGATYVTDFGGRVTATSRTTALTVSVPRRLSSNAKRALTHGVVYRASCSRACTLVGRLFPYPRSARSSGRTAVADSLRMARAGGGMVTAQLTATAKRALRHFGHLTLTLVTTASGTEVARTTRVSLR